MDVSSERAGTVAPTSSRLSVRCVFPPVEVTDADGDDTSDLNEFRPWRRGPRIPNPDAAAALDMLRCDVPSHTHKAHP